MELLTRLVSQLQQYKSLLRSQKWTELKSRIKLDRTNGLCWWKCVYIELHTLNISLNPLKLLYTSTEPMHGKFGCQGAKMSIVSPWNSSSFLHLLTVHILTDISLKQNVFRVLKQILFSSTLWITYLRRSISLLKEKCWKWKFRTNVS